MNQTSFFFPIQDFTKLSKLFNNNNFHHQFTNDIFNIPIHQQHVFQTSTTTIIHEFIPSSSNHNFIIHHFSQKTQHIHTYHQQLDMYSFIKFHISTYFQNHLIG